jgi:hypothetical protein
MRATMAETKTTHFGRAGEFFAMSELLLRGWNVAVPVVDVGDDVFVIDDRDKATRRLQVKTSAMKPSDSGDGSTLRAVFNLSRTQLRSPHEIELYYMLVMRTATRWRFLVVSRGDLFEIRDAYVETAGKRAGFGRRPLADEGAKTDELLLKVEIDSDEIKGWGTSLSKYLDQWPDALGIVVGGPGSTTTGVMPDVTVEYAEDPDPSPDPGR